LLEVVNATVTPEEWERLLAKGTCEGDVCG